MRFFGQRIGNGLVPDGAESVEAFEKLPFNKPFRIDAVQARNIKMHRLYWALCARIGRGIGKDAEWVSDAFKVETGHYSVFHYGGKEVLQLKSIAFDRFDQIAFRDFFNSCCEIAYRVWKIDPADLADLLIPEGYRKLVK